MFGGYDGGAVDEIKELAMAGGHCGDDRPDIGLLEGHRGRRPVRPVSAEVDRGVGLSGSKDKLCTDRNGACF